MPSSDVSTSRTLVETLDIAPSLYKRAIDRHRSLGEWLCRNGSRLKNFNP